MATLPPHPAPPAETGSLTPPAAAVPTDRAIRPAPLPAGTPVRSSFVIHWGGESEETAARRAATAAEDRLARARALVIEAQQRLAEAQCHYDVVQAQAVAARAWLRKVQRRHRPAA